jgi:UDP-N-acetylglucosamine--N-acetylmuramyl-(pentapeptide) pyrophosphoryl-undecaprenol N-acetylglucosamine transferase
MPLRKEICKIEKSKARENLGIRSNGFILTVLGGSQGAGALSDWAYENFRKLNLHNIAVCCVRGVKNRETQIIAGKSMDGGDIVNSFLPFCSDMQSLLSASDLLLCRAGAGTISEAVHCSVPMILVPYPEAADNHQEANAIHAAKNGHAIVVRQDDMNSIMDLILQCFHRNFENFKFSGAENDQRPAVDTIVSFAQKISQKK